jgi:coproporphyrinogen III oxidase
MTFRLLNTVLVIVFCTSMGCTTAGTGTGSRSGNDGVQGLNEEQQAFAQRFLQFQDDMDQQLFGQAGEINGGHASDDSKTVSDEYADFYVRVARGDVVEKIGRMISRIYKPKSEIQRPTTFGRYYGLDVHAKSPLMGHVHSAIVLQYYEDGTGALGGTLNLLKGAAQKEDRDYVQNALDAVFEKHGRDPKPYRDRVCNSAQEDSVQPEYHRKLSCVGASFFGFPMMEVNEANFVFMTEAYAAFVSAFLDTVEARQDQPFTEADVAKQEAMRLNWAEDQFLGDPYSSSGIAPYSVWGAAFLPPTVKF